MMNPKTHCEELLGPLCDYLEGNMRDALCEDLERHLEGCEHCRVVVDTTRKTIELYHETAADMSLPEDTRRRLFARLDLEEYLQDAPKA